VLDLLDAGLPAPARGVFTTRQGGFSAPPWDSLNLAVHVDEWKNEIGSIEEWFDKIGADKIPTTLWTELDGLKARLGVK